MKKDPSARPVGRPKLDAPSETYVQQRGSILHKAKQLLDEAGFGNLSLARIAQALGVSKASMYYYFGSNHHLLYALYEDYLDRQFEKMSQVMSVPDPRERVVQMLRCQIQGILGNLQVVRLRLSHFPFIDDPIVERCLRKELRHTTALTKVVENAIAAGHLPGINSFLLMEILFGSPLLVYRTYSPEEFTPAFVESQIVSLFRLA